MSDHIERAADEIIGIQVGTGYESVTIGIDEAMEAARALDAAGLLVTPEHDAAVAAKALREAAGEINNPNATPDLESVARAVVYLRDRADRIEREVGESDATG